MVIGKGLSNGFVIGDNPLQGGIDLKFTNPIKIQTTLFFKINGIKLMVSMCHVKKTIG